MPFSALTISTNIGLSGARFIAPISGMSAGGIVTVIRGEARTGSAGLVVDRLPYGVSNITVRETNSDGFRDTDFVVYGVSVLDERSTLIAALAKGQTDAQQRTAIAAGASVYAGLQSAGLAMVPVSGGTPTPTPTPSPTLNALTVSNGTGTVGTALSSTISGLTSGSSVALTGAGAAGLSISGAVITGTPTTAGAVNIVETLAGATNSPRTTSGVITVSAAVPGAVTPPAAFTTAYAQTGVGPAPAAIPATVSRTGSGTASTFTTNYDPEAKRPSVTNTYYVDKSVGDAGKNNDGLTSGTAVPSIAIAQALANVASAATRILIVPGTYLASVTYARTASPAATYTQSLTNKENGCLALILEPTTTNGRVVNLQDQVMPNAYATTTDTNIYKTAYTASESPGAVCDFANIDTDGIPRRLAQVLAVADPTNPVAEINALWSSYSACRDHPADASYPLGACYLDATNRVLWVRRFNNAAPDTNMVVLRTNAAALCGNVASPTKAITYFLRNMDFWGGKYPFIARSTSAGTFNTNVYASGCTYAFGIYAGAFSFENGGGDIIQFNCVASYADSDGFNYHGFPGSTDPSLSPRVLEINCRSKWAGWNTAGTNNGSTWHEFVRGIRVNGSYLHAQDRPFHDVYGAQTWGLGCEASTRHGADGLENGGVFVSGQSAGTGASASVGAAYLDACRIVPNYAGVAPPYTLEAYQTATLYHANDAITVTPANPGTGTITSYVP